MTHHYSRSTYEHSKLSKKVTVKVFIDISKLIHKILPQIATSKSLIPTVSSFSNILHQGIFLVTKLIKEISKNTIKKSILYGLIYRRFSSLDLGFGTKPHFLRNQKRILPCAQDKNLFRFYKKPFLFRV